MVIGTIVRLRLPSHFSCNAVRHRLMCAFDDVLVAASWDINGTTLVCVAPDAALGTVVRVDIVMVLIYFLNSSHTQHRL